MNAPILPRTSLLLLVFSLGNGLVNSLCGQSPAPSDPASQAKAEQDALQVKRQEASAAAAFRREQAMQAAGKAAGPNLAATASASASTTTATSATNDIPALRVAVSSVNESRNSDGRGSINLNLSIVGEGLLSSAVVRQINVTRAEDNLGNILSPNSGPGGRGGGSGLVQSRMMTTLAGMRGVMGGLSGQASISGSVRRAESLKYVEGTIELYLPSESNGSMIRIPNALSHAGRIEDPVLAKQGVEFYFLPDQASYDDAKNQVAGFQARAEAPDFPNAVGYFVRDPSGRWASQQFQDASGALIRTNGYSSSGSGNGQTGNIRLLAPLPPDAQLVLFLIVPEAIKTVPFRVEDIALP
jgi:hypothetical protein